MGQTEGVLRLATGEILKVLLKWLDYQIRGYLKAPSLALAFLVKKWKKCFSWLRQDNFYWTILPELMIPQNMVNFRFVICIKQMTIHYYGKKMFSHFKM